MLVINKLNDVFEFKNRTNIEKKSLGFVPTMGALHNGHISLVLNSIKENDYTIASIFVNPTQFNNKTDLLNYPRTVDKDIEILEKAGCDFVFIPDLNEMYPEEDTRIFDFDGLDEVMEGKHRPGHFNGVAQIVTKLFEAVKPDRAYFGRKDFQQAAIINFLVKKYMPEFNIKIITCDIVREKDGLALSSRNILLTPEHRKAAPIIFKTLNLFSKVYSDIKPQKIIEKVTNEINAVELLKVEYFEIVDNETLMPVNEIIPGKTTGCIAVFAGNVRLIDNISF
jgi:pantoate--beta-alanine ligase